MKNNESYKIIYLIQLYDQFMSLIQKFEVVNNECTCEKK